MPSTPSVGSTAQSHTAAQTSASVKPPSSSKAKWRCVQILTGFLGWLMAMGVMFASYYTIYDRSSLLAEMLKLAEEDLNGIGVTKESSHISLVMNGSLGVALLAIVLGILITCVVSCESSCWAVVFGILNVALFLIASGFGGLGMLNREYAVILTSKMMKYSIENRYTTLDVAKNYKGDQWRALVDRVQIVGECCGVDKGYQDYKDIFPNLTVIIPKSGGSITANRLACICLDGNQTQCGLQHLPLSCCKRFKNSAGIDLSCAINVFPNVPTTSKRCSSTKPMKSKREAIIKQSTIKPGPPKSTTLAKPVSKSSMYNSKKCEKKEIEKMEHVHSLFCYGMVNFSIAVASLVIFFLLLYLACKWRNGGKSNVQSYTAMTPRNPSNSDPSGPSSAKSSKGPNRMPSRKSLPPQSEKKIASRKK